MSSLDKNRSQPSSSWPWELLSTKMGISYLTKRSICPAREPRILALGDELNHSHMVCALPVSFFPLDHVMPTQDYLVFSSFSIQVWEQLGSDDSLDGLESSLR